jgi:ABC-2 type transport system permease protein
LGEITFSAPSIAILIGLLGYLHLIGLNVAVLLGVMFLAWLSASSLGFFLSTYILQSRSAFSITSLVATLLTVVPPVFYPITIIPTTFRWLAYLVPTTHLSILMQATIGLQSYSTLTLAFSWSVLIGFALLLLAIAAYKARWRQP